MGVNIRCVFHNNVESDRLALIIGKLAGLPSHMESLGWHGNPRHEVFVTRVEGVKVKSGASINRRKGKRSTIMEPSTGTCQFQFNGDMVDGEDDHWVMFHWESTDEQREGFRGLKRVIIPKSTPFWCAVCTRLVQHFGGYLLYSDAHGPQVEGTKWDLVVPPRWSAGDTTDKHWQKNQTRLHEMAPVSYEEMMAFEHIAAYHALPPNPNKELGEVLAEVGLADSKELVTA